MRLSVQIEFDKIQDLYTKKTSVIVGRAADVADLVVGHSSISRRHCKLELIEKELFITDLKSSNGVMINGERIPPMVKTRIPAKATVHIAKLECEISDQNRVIDASGITKIQSQEINPDFTSTIRIARIDLEKDILETREVTKSPPRVKGPRNPITYLEPKKVKKSGSVKSFIFYLLLIALLALALLFYRSFKTI